MTEKLPTISRRNTLKLLFGFGTFLFLDPLGACQAISSTPTPKPEPSPNPEPTPTPETVLKCTVEIIKASDLTSYTIFHPDIKTPPQIPVSNQQQIIEEVTQTLKEAEGANWAVYTDYGPNNHVGFSLGYHQSHPFPGNQKNIIFIMPQSYVDLGDIQTSHAAVTRLIAESCGVEMTNGR